MDNNNLEKKKECIIMLVKDDIALYNQFLPKIEKMSDIEIQKLFEGDFQYFETESNNQFKMLVSKFQNFSSLLFQWYDKSDKMKYLKELWEYNICFEDLLNLSKEQLETFMSGKTSYKNWPLNIKGEYQKCILNNGDTIVFVMKSTYQSMTEFEQNIYNSLEDLIKTNGEECPGIKKASEKYEYELMKNASNKFANISLKTFMRFKNKIIPPSWQNSSFSKKIKNMIDKCNGHIPSNMDSIFDGISGLMDLASSIEDFISINERVKQFEEFKDKLKIIVDDFNTNKKVFLNSDELYYYSLGKLKEEIQSGINKIKGNIDDLNKLILEIENAIEQCKKGRNSSFIASILSGFSLGLSLGGYIQSHDRSKLFGFGTNTASAAINSINAVRYSYLIEDLKKLLEEAKKKKKEMLDDIEKIKNTIRTQLKIINEGIPKYY